VIPYRDSQLFEMQSGDQPDFSVSDRRPEARDGEKRG
jgi:hypothetical protein